MFVISTTGPNNATKAVLPFMTGKGAMTREEPVALFFMQEATYLASESHTNLSELTAPGLPPIAAILEELRESGTLEEAIVCDPCASARNIDADDLREWARLGSAEDLARLTESHETTVSF